LSGLVHICRAEEREFQIVVATTLKLWAPNEVWTYGMESKLVFDNVRDEWNDEHAKLKVDKQVETNRKCGK